MKSVLQRVSEASVTVDGQVVGRIGAGMLVLFGVEKGDDASKLDYHVKKLLNLRIFADEAGKMNRSVQDIGGGLLIVSQFTLAGDCRKGNRPGFDNAMSPVEAECLYEQFVVLLRMEAARLAISDASDVDKSQPVQIATGRFGAMMQVALVNDGPVTFLLEN